MDLILTYDVETTTPQGRRRLRQMAKLCEGYGNRVQKSVFEIVASDIDLLTLLDQANKIIDEERDSVRVYQLPHRGFDAVHTLGTARTHPHRDDVVL
jgi:CRISPR-associated protein Cas2